MARSNCRSGTDLKSAGIASGEREAAEAKRPLDIRRYRSAARYLYVAGALAIAALLIVMAVV